MKIIRGRNEGSLSEHQTATFTGTVWADTVLPATDGTSINNVFFAPGSRTHWHSHEQGQVLHVVAGAGLVCAERGTPQPIGVGDTVWVPAGERHWHGASADSYLLHTAVSLGDTSWDQPVSETDYASGEE